MPLFGIETEYGIAVEGKGASDLVTESRAVVNAYKGKYASPWYYRGEDARNDMRGFHVDKLTHDPEDAKFDDPNAPPLPAEQERADHVLLNGARLYNDHGHPEYSTPECSTLIDLVTADKAGERIVLACARAHEEHAGGARVHIFKNNTDFHGSSYGCHENYLVSRARPFGEWIACLIPFLVTRIVYTGAGKVGTEPRSREPIYQLSQRADFFTEEASVDTLHRRPLVNTRDEPHADPRKYRRLHVICGDANLSEYATALKMGTTSLVTMLLDAGWSPKVQIANAVGAIKEISRDQSYAWPVRLSDGSTISALDIQRVYLDAACEEFAGSSADADWTIREWGKVLESLASDPMLLVDRLDWVAKKSLVDEYLASENRDWDDEVLQSVDLAYSNIDPEEGLYEALAQSGEMVRITSDEAIEAAMTRPPASTRAAIRSEFVSRFADKIGAIGWNCVILRTPEESWLADLNEYISPERIQATCETLRNAQDLPALLAAFRGN